MKRLSSLEKKELLELYIKKLSLREIQRKLKVPLSTIQYHTNKQNPNKKTRIKSIILPNSNFTKGEILGAFAGDGSYYHDTSGGSGKYNIRYFFSYKEKEYADYITFILKNMGLNVNRYVRCYKGKLSSIEVRVHSIKLLEFIRSNLYFTNKKTKTICLLNKINKYDNNFLFGFARGLMDTDGFVEPYNVACAVISKELIFNLKQIFLKAKIKPYLTKRIRKNRKDLFILRIHKRDLKNFYKYIGFSNSLKKQKLDLIMKKNGGTRI